MIATKQMDVRANIKKYFDMAFDGEPVIVSRKENRNVVIISEPCPIVKSHIGIKNSCFINILFSISII